jgi:trehalose 6-phosphate phosphatase
MRFDRFDLRNSAILLDVDGTILDIAPMMHEVYVSNSLRHTLARLSEGANGALALVSGRPLQDLDFLFAPLRLPAIGGHGAEIRLSTTNVMNGPPPISLDRELKQRLREIAVKYPGVAIEDKGYSLALHYRLAPERELDVVSEVFRLRKYFDPDAFELLTGKAVIEVKKPGYNKGTAVRELMKYPPFAGRVPVFIGDDTTDEAAFAVMPEFDGTAFTVGRRILGIDGMFQTPREVRRWLERISTDSLAAGHG